MQELDQRGRLVLQTLHFIAIVAVYVLYGHWLSRAFDTRSGPIKSTIEEIHRARGGCKAAAHAGGSAVG
jgi:hypothetical protein